MAILASERLLILACSATKRGEQKYLRAIERYDGPLWRTLRAVDPDGEKAKVAFLSAHLGFRAADTPIEIYDARMTAEMACAMKAGNLGTPWPRPKTQRRCMPPGEHPGMHISSLRDWPRGPAFSDVALVGGRLYLDVIRHLVDLFQDAGHVSADAHISEINGSIGLMRRELRLWLERGDWEAR